VLVACSPECADGRVDVAFQRVQAVLRSHHFVTLRSQRRDQFLETHPVRGKGPARAGALEHLDEGHDVEREICDVIDERDAVCSRSGDGVGALRLTPAKGEILTRSFVERD
jgi:hypothetical protein